MYIDLSFLPFALLGAIGGVVLSRLIVRPLSRWIGGVIYRWKHLRRIYRNRQTTYKNRTDVQKRADHNYLWHDRRSP